MKPDLTAEQQQTRAIGFLIGCAGASFIAIGAALWWIGSAIVEALR